MFKVLYEVKCLTIPDFIGRRAYKRFNRTIAQLNSDGATS